MTAELEKRRQAFNMRCFERLLNISYKDHVTNKEVHRKIHSAIAEYDELLTLVKKRKLRWFSKDNPTGHSERKNKKRQTEEEMGQEWTRAAENRTRWKGVVDDLPRLWDRIK